MGFIFRKAIVENTVAEYLGLPGSGKSWYIENRLYRLKESAPHTVPLGGGKTKLFNTIRGIFSNPPLFFRLLRLAFHIYSSEKSKFLIRPFLVIFERYGRIIRLRKNQSNEIHLDEGVLQFIWRVFSELSNTQENKLYLRKCISCLTPAEHTVVYISCPKEKHISHVIKRNKVSSNFDAAIVRGNNNLYLLGRYWMAQVLKESIRHGIRINIVQNK